MHFLPRNESSHGAGHEDRHGKSPVLAIAGTDGLGLLFGSPSAMLVKIGFGSPQTLRILAGLSGNMKGSPTEHAGRDIADALDRVAPATVEVLVLGQPGETAGDEIAMVCI